MLIQLRRHVRRWAPLVGAGFAVLLALAVEVEAARHEFRDLGPSKYGHSGAGYVL